LPPQSGGAFLSDGTLALPCTASRIFYWK
jgi:hypothetical protein